LVPGLPGGPRAAAEPALPMSTLIAAGRAALPQGAAIVVVD
jgi:hypothetical protein